MSALRLRRRLRRRWRSTGIRLAGLRNFVEGRMLEAEENVKKIVEELEKMPIETPRGFSVASVREDRDSS